MTNQTTREVVDDAKIGTHGYPRHYEALGIEPPKKVVPIENGTPRTDHPGLSLPEYAAAKRWEREVGGIELNSLQVATDDRSKLMISGARQGAEANAEFTTQWKAPSGFITLDAAQIIAISNAVLAHVAACFAIEQQVLAAIETGEVTTTEQIDAAYLTA